MTFDFDWFAEMLQRIGATPDATRIFLSHSSQDSGIARALAVLLRRAMGAKWYVFNSADAYTLYPGLPWESAVTEELARANGLVLLLSQSALESKWVKREFEIAQQKAVPIFPCSTETCLLPARWNRLHISSSDACTNTRMSSLFSEICAGFTGRCRDYATPGGNEVTT